MDPKRLEEWYMKKWIFAVVAVLAMSPSFGEEAKTEHKSSDKKVESTEKAGAERAKKEESSKSDLSKKLDACLAERPATAEKK